MNLKIGILTAHPDIAKSISQYEFNENIQLLYRSGFLDTAQSIAHELQDRENVNAIITVGIPMVVFQRPLSIPVYPIYPSSYDIIHALYQARSKGEKLAFAEVPYGSIFYDINQITEILGFDVAHYRFAALEHLTHRQSVELVVDQVMADGRDVLVTMGGYSHTYAENKGFPSIMVTPDVQSVQMTLDSAQKIFLSNQLEKEKTRWLNAVFDSAKEGVMVLDNENKVVVINNSAKKFMRLEDDILNRHIDSINSANPLFRQFFNTSSSFEVVKSRTREYAVKKEILYDDNQPLGMVIRANPVKELQRLEMDTRRKISESGFVAASTFSDIKGSSQSFQEVKDTAKVYAKSRSNIILYGESGSGKEIFAQSIHNESLCKDGPFVAINCTVLTESLLESELFGYEDGAFTGAKKGGKQGVFELAHRGTLFLDEIGDMPLGIQVKLLRVLQERMVRRIGGSRNIPVEVRFIFATNRNLQQDIERGRFRSDLYYRINVLSIHLPALREHREDLKEVAQAMIRRLSDQSGKSFSLSDECYRIMQEYHWPGNIRELNNFLERAVFLDSKDEASIAGMIRQLMPDEPEESNQPDSSATQAPQPGTGHHGHSVPSGPAQAAGQPADAITLLPDTMRNMESAIIRELYHRYGGSRKKTSDALGISPSALYRKLKEMGL